ncbi:MAG TPA: hypothetical protein VKU36_06045 [Candidatus Babeliales bacterium]|nr:hypothetical protein [Candidatus Babeliales bacterium]
MKISRIALLSAVLFVAPYSFTSESSNTTDTTSTNSTTPSQQAPETLKDKISNDVQNIKDELSNVGDKAKADASSLAAKIGGFVAVPFVAASGLAGKIADKTLLTSAISKITNSKYLQNTRVNNPALIGQLIVFTVAGAAAYKLYTMYNADSEDNDDELIFASEYDDNN